MKRTLFLICTLLCANVLMAQTRFWVDSLQYKVTSTNPAEVEVYSANQSIVIADIPATVTYEETDYSVTSIRAQAFYNCSSLTSVTIPNSVTAIDDYAFNDCSSLTSVTIPNSVTSIGYSAFYDCSSLTSVTIPNSVTSIGNYAFSSCYSLTSVTIPNSVTSIGNYAFEYCISLTSVTIPNSVTSIGDMAFANCSSLTTLNFNAINCEGFDLYDHPFRNCPITTINIGDSVQRIPANFAYNLSSLTSITIPNSVSSIGTVTIGHNVTSIGNNAFSNCSSLTTLNFNAINCEDFTSDYYDHPFSNCPITTINIGDSVQRIPACFACGLDLTSISIPNSVTSIGGAAFYDCSGLTSITIPNSVTSIGAYAFAGCSITSVTIPNSVTSIGDYAFNGCSSLTSVTIGNSVTSIEYGTFAYCSSLTSITIPNSVTSIGSSAFYGCDSLTSITIGNSVTSIGNSAFSGCSSLTSITIPNSVTSIGSGAFSYCSSLNSVTIGNSVTSIGAYAFDGCSFLQNVTCLATTPPTLEDNTVFPYPNIATLTVPCGTLEAYSSPTSFWNMFFNGRISEDCNNEGGDSGLEDVEDTELSFYPNPTNSKVTFNQAIERIEVIDLTGRCILTFSNAREINIESLPSGAYYLRLTNNDKAIMRKVIKE